MLAALIIGGLALAFFIWLMLPSESPSGSSAGTERRESDDESFGIGVGTGLLGGDIEDAAIARYALSRTPRDPNSSDERDLGTALGMQNGIDF